MTASSFLDPADCPILEALTWKVRVAADIQIQAMMDERPGAKPTACRLLRRWQSLGLVDRRVLTVSLIEVTEPLVLSHPCDVSPDFDALAWQLESRWTNVLPRRIVVNWATPRAAKLYGGISGRFRQPLQIQHDLGTAAAYFRRLKTDPKAAAAWIGEDVYRRDFPIRKRAKVPDAVQIDEFGRVSLAIEFGGAYSASRLRRFHQFCSQAHLPYEVW
jgi:hypothetical protein